METKNILCVFVLCLVLGSPFAYADGDEPTTFNLRDISTPPPPFNNRDEHKFELKDGYFDTLNYGLCCGKLNMNFSCNVAVSNNDFNDNHNFDMGFCVGKIKSNFNGFVHYNGIRFPIVKFEQLKDRLKLQNSPHDQHPDVLRWVLQELSSYKAGKL